MCRQTKKGKQRMQSHIEFYTYSEIVIPFLSKSHMQKHVWFARHLKSCWGLPPENIFGFNFMRSGSAYLFCANIPRCVKLLVLRKVSDVLTTCSTSIK